MALAHDDVTGERQENRRIADRIDDRKQAGKYQQDRIDEVAQNLLFAAGGFEQKPGAAL